MKFADIAFLGTVRDVTFLFGPKHVVRFDASRVWKGPVRRSFVLYQAPWVAFDSWAFPSDAVGKQYVVFALRLTAAQRKDFTLTEREDAFAVPACGLGTFQLRDGYDVSRQLGAGRAPR